MLLNHFVQVNGGDGKNQNIAGINDLLHLNRHVQFVCFERDALDVIWVTAVAPQVIACFFPPNPPVQVFFIGEHHLGNGRGP